MNDLLLQKCDLLVKNRADIHTKFFLENELMSVAAALVFTAEGQEADVDKMKSCRKLLNSKTRLLSNLRDIVELVILSKMALAEDPEKYLEDFLAVYNKIIKGKFLENDYMVLASILILDHGLQDQCDEILDRAGEIQKRMNSDHPILTSADDTSFIMFLAITRKSVDAVLADLSAGFTYLTETCKTKINKDPAYELCEVLAVSYGDMEEKCDKALRIHNALLKKGSNYGTGYIVSSIGSLIDTDLEPDKLADEIVEAETYLKKQKGFSDLSMDRSIRVMYAALLASAVYGSRPEATGNSVISNTLSIVWAKKIAKMISLVVQAAPSAAAAVMKDNSDSSTDSTDTSDSTATPTDKVHSKE